MSFDPYREWLQIDGLVGPPSHYDLLGVAPIEHDEDRIRQAVNERVDRVRRYQLGPQGSVALRVIGELSQAFACLSDPEQRRKYDAQFQQAETLVVRSAKIDTVKAPRSPPDDAWAPPVVVELPPSLASAAAVPPPVDATRPGMRQSRGRRATSFVRYGPNWRPAADRQRPMTIVLAVAGSCVLFAGSAIAWKVSGGRQLAAGDAPQVASSTPDVAVPPPQIRIEDVTPTKPVEREPITVRIGTDREDRSEWTFHYRRNGAANWLRMPGDVCIVADAPAGPLRMEFKALDPRGQSSRILKLEMDVEPAALAAATATPDVPAEPPAPATPPPNLAPKVRLVDATPLRPVAAEDLTVRLDGEDEDVARLRFQFRRPPSQDWVPAPDGKAVVYELPAGELQLEFRAIDREDLASPVVAHAVVVEANPHASWGATQSIQGHRAAVNGIGFRGASGLASVGDDGTLRFWNAANGAELMRVPTSSTATLVADKDKVATASAGGTVDVWKKGEVTASYQTAIAAAGPLRRDVANVQEFGALPANLPMSDELRRLMGGFGGAGFPGNAGLLDKSPPRATHTQLHVSLDSSQVFARQLNQFWSYKMLPGGGLRQQHRWHGETIATASAMSKQGRLVAVGLSGTNEVALYRTLIGSLDRTLTGLDDAVHCLVFSADEKLVAGGDVRGNVVIWRTDTGKQVSAFKAHDNYVAAMAIAGNENGVLLTGGEDGEIRLWRLRDGRRMRTLVEHQTRITCATFEPGDDRAVTGDADGKIVLWSGK